MAAQSPGRRQALHIPDGHQQIRADTGELAASGTPGDVVEQDRVALHDLQTLPTCDIPQTQGAICTPSEQSKAVGREGEAEHHTRMSIERRPVAAALDIPEPDRFVKAAT